MEPFIVFIIRNDVWILILCAMGLFWYITELFRARRLLRRAMFGLERETGTRMRNNALLFITIFASIVLLVYYVNTRVAPNLPPEVLNPVPATTPDIFLTPLSSPTPLGGPAEQQPTPTPPLAPTVTLPGSGPPQDDGSPDAPIPAVTPTPFVACTQDLNFTQPRDGAGYRVKSASLARPIPRNSVSTRWKLTARRRRDSGPRCSAATSTRPCARAFWGNPTSACGKTGHTWCGSRPWTAAATLPGSAPSA